MIVQVGDDFYIDPARVTTVIKDGDEVTIWLLEGDSVSEYTTSWSLARVVEAINKLV